MKHKIMKPFDQYEIDWNIDHGTWEIDFGTWEIDATTKINTILKDKTTKTDTLIKDKE